MQRGSGFARNRTRCRPFFLWVAIWLVAGWVSTAARAEVAREYDLKAVFLYNFSAFVTWPSPANPFRVCVYGEDPFRNTLDDLLAAKSDGVVYRVERPARPDALRDCRILYISRSEQGNLRKIIDGLDGAPVLTVTDLENGGGAPGAMINLVTVGGRIGFEIDQSAAQSSRLTISSKLLALARRVR